MSASAVKNLDPELKTYYLQVKDEIKKDHTSYIEQHPEIKQLLNDYLSTLLLEKPDDVYSYTQEYFSFFNNEKEGVQHKPLVISGPSGVGKGTLVQLLLKHFPDVFELSVSYTTRKPRPGENHGQHYFFLSDEEFKSEITKQSFAEHTEVHGNFYGTHKGYLKGVMERSKICIVEIDVHGAHKMKKNGADCRYVWIDPPSITLLRERLAGRGTETEEVVNRRIKNAESEISESRKNALYEKYIINHQLEEAFSQLLESLNELYEGLSLKVKA